MPSDELISKLEAELQGNQTLIAGLHDALLAEVQSYCVSLKMLDFYPVGSVYVSLQSDFDPNSEWGGTWEKIEGRMIVGSGTVSDGTNSATYEVGGTGGELKHTLTIAEMPSHAHRVHAPKTGGTYTAYIAKADGSGYEIPPNMGFVENTWYSTIPTTWGQSSTGRSEVIGDMIGSTAMVGSGNAHNVVSPYLVANIWKRTA